MSAYLGDYIAGTEINFKFTTFSPIAGAPSALTSGSVRVYKGSSATEVTTGVTLTTDVDVAGLNHVTIDTSDAWYATGNDYSVVLYAGTVASTSVAGTTLKTFSIENRNVKADLRKIDGTALSSATLNLKKLNVVNSSGDAAVFQSTGPNGIGLTVQGNGTAPAVRVLGGSTSGDGMEITGYGTGNGILARCDTGTGDGLHLQGGDESGYGLHATSPTEATDVDFKLGSDALDGISTGAPTGVASNFREMLVQVWRRFFKKATKSSTQIKTYADNGSTVVTTQTISSSGSDEEQGAAS